MRKPSAGGSKPSTAQKSPSRSTDPGQVDIKLPFLRLCIDGTYEWMKLESTTDGISLLTGDLDLGHVPDVRHCWPKEASWDQRFCIRADLASHAEDHKPPQLDPRVRGTYYVMVCKLKELGQHGAVQLSEAKVNVRGDALIFKASEKGRDVNGRAVFGEVPAEISAWALLDGCFGK